MEPLTWSVEAEIAREDAAFDPSGGPYVPIVFSHGSTNDPYDYAHLLEAIADAGFIVAAPGHTNNTQDDVRRDCINQINRTRVFECRDGLDTHPETFDEPQIGNGYPRLVPDCAKNSVPNSMSERVRDVRTVLDKLPEWFGGHVDVERAGVFGHSHGTVTALAVAGGSVPWRPNSVPKQPPVNCASPQPADALCWEGVRPDPRVKAIMGMAIGAAAINNSVDIPAITIPTRLVYGGKDINTQPGNTTLPAYDRLTTADASLVPPKGDSSHPLHDATHRSFDSNYCAQLQSAGAAFDTDHDGIVSAEEAAADDHP